MSERGLVATQVDDEVGGSLREGWVEERGWVGEGINGLGSGSRGGRLR